MTLSRRKTLALIGGGAIVAAAGTTGLAVTRQPRTALLPWEQAGHYEEPRKRALSHAILAPNPHNRQPWKVDLRTDGQVALYVDTDRLLPHTDPFSRQIVIGLGCFLEVMRIAALEDGYDVTNDLFPDGSDPERLDARPVAVCTFRKTDVAKDPLFAQIPHRRSLKEPYDMTRPVAPKTLETVLGAARMHGTGGTVAADDLPWWRDLTRKALMIEIETPRTHMESVELFRIGAREVDANPDGLDFSGPLFEAGSLFRVFTREKAADPATTAYQGGIDYITANTDTAMGMLWLVSDTNSRADQIAAGRDWVRINLAATAEGLGMQPMSQALQEYPEMEVLYKSVHEKLAPQGGTVQMLARIGYGPDVSQSPRWPLESKIVHG